MSITTNAKNVRVIARLDVKGPNVVKGIHLEGLRVVGKPAELARQYYEQGADEILYIDIVASLYERNNLQDIVKEAISLGVFVPMTVGGGVRSVEDIRKLLMAGADKVAINTAATRNPELITKAAKIFGAQCIVGSIEAKRSEDGKSWEAYIDNGRERTNKDAIEWAKELVKLGAGELLITSVDNEGVQKGFDNELIEKITAVVNVPVIAGGGAGSPNDITNCIKATKCDAIAIASILHYKKSTIKDIKEAIAKENIPVRPFTDHQEKSPAANAPTISIIDYGVGNIMSVISGFKKVGCNVKVISTPEELKAAHHLVLPGVGAFEDGMKGLRERNLIVPLQEHVKTNKPLLGICLGSQLLMSESEEFGKHQGLNLIPGSVIKFRSKEIRIPHICWNQVVQQSSEKWNSTIFNSMSNNFEAYFIHSYCMVPKDKNTILATTTYGQETFCSAIKMNNIYGCQFHPEKSGAMGLAILNHFAQEVK